MKKFLVLLLSIVSVFAKAQGPQTTITVPITTDGVTEKALLYLPSGYTTTKKYPILIFLHGAGEAADGSTAGVGVAKLYTNTTSNAYALIIAQGNWPDSFRVGGNGAFKQLIVLSPQGSTWSTSGPQLDPLIKFMVTNYAVDTNNIIIGGISAGGEGLVDYVIHNGVTPRWEPSFIIPMSEAHDQITQVNGNTIANDSVKGWGFGDPINDIHGEFTQDLITFMNNRVAGIGRFTTYSSGHCCWLQFAQPTYREVIGGVSQNIIEYALKFPRNQAVTPTATAGPNQNITLPNNSVLLNGSGTPGVGHSITSYTWTKISGPATFTITNPGPSLTASTTNINNLVAGTYVFRLTVTNNIAVTATSDITITVNPAAAVQANAGTNQTITLPTSTATLSGSASTGSITSYLWTQLLGPNSATIANPTSISTGISSLIAGTYTFQLSVNGGASTATVQVQVNTASAFPPCGSHLRLNATVNADTGWHVSAANGLVFNYHPGDTIVFTNHSPDVPRFVYISIEDFQGNPSCPLVLINGSSPTLVENLAGDSTFGHNGTIEINNSSYVELSGSGVPGKTYGFLVQGDPTFLYDLGTGVQTIGNSHDLRVHNVEIHNMGTGFWSKNNGSCLASDNFPSYTLHSVEIDHNYVHSIWNEGMYIGNTSPDNQAPGTGIGDYDPRPITCADTTFYPIPPRIGRFHVHHNIVDTTGRGGIQMASASDSISEIDHNLVKHNGVNGDDAQGTAISIGAYTRAYIHDDSCISVLTWPIASLGGSGTNVLQRIENNYLDSAGYQPYHDLAETQRAKINPLTEPWIVNPFPWPQLIFIDTKPTVNPIDSTIVSIKGNIMGLMKNTVGQAILIQNDFHTLQLKGPNVIACNFNKGTTVLAPISIDPTATGFTFSTSCNIPPVVSAGNNQVILYPNTTQVTLTGTASATSPATITSRTWTKVSGPLLGTITTPNALVTTVTAMIPGIYIFQLSVTDSNGSTSTSQVTVTVTQVATVNDILLFRYKTIFLNH